jgi:hypothetical protein
MSKQLTASELLGVYHIGGIAADGWYRVRSLERSHQICPLV